MAIEYTPQDFTDVQRQRYIRIGRSRINIDAVDALENRESATRLHLRGGTTIEVDAGDLEELVEALERHYDA